MNRNYSNNRRNNASFNDGKSMMASSLEDYLMEMKSISKDHKHKPIDVDLESQESSSTDGSLKQPIINMDRKVLAPGVTQYTTRVVEEDCCKRSIKESSQIMNENEGLLISIERTDIIKTCPGNDTSLMDEDDYYSL
ncbi:uncharacterized protein [Prorops nasuta]|uniref:uncharacterized protein n=1 Tax=Prorops nasuta TaxID=863751 RepID=UPI0034CF599E